MGLEALTQPIITNLNCKPRCAITRWVGSGGRCLSMIGSSRCLSGKKWSYFIYYPPLWQHALRLKTISSESSPFFNFKEKWPWVRLGPKDQGKPTLRCQKYLFLLLQILWYSGDRYSNTLPSRRGWLGRPIQVTYRYNHASFLERLRLLLAIDILCIIMRGGKWVVEKQAWENSLRSSNWTAAQLLAWGMSLRTVIFVG